MHESLMNIPGYKYAEYRLVLNPHEDLRQKIAHARKQFSEKFNTTHITGGKPHITLATFTVWEMMEEKIKNRVKIAAMGTAAFKVLLKDYGSFPSHTIFINITTKIPIQKLVKEIRSSKSKSPRFIA